MNLVIDCRVVVGVGAALAGLAVGYLAGWLARARRDVSLRRLVGSLSQSLDARVARLEGFIPNEMRGALPVRRSPTSDHSRTTVFARPSSRSSTPPPLRKEEAKTAVMTFDPFADDEHAAHD